MTMINQDNIAPDLRIVSSHVVVITTVMNTSACLQVACHAMIGKNQATLVSASPDHLATYPLFLDQEGLLGRNHKQRCRSKHLLGEFNKFNKVAGK